MKQYEDYGVDDFLADDDFVQWVRNGSSLDLSVWQNLLTAFPEKEADLDEARTFILQTLAGVSLSKAELNQEINRILASTDSARVVPVLSIGSRFYWWRVAAAITLLFGLGWAGYEWQSAQSPFAYEKLIKASAIPLTEIVNANQTPQSITLPDGSHITLAKNARISYSAQMAKEPSREVFLCGEAFFEVTKDPQHPFFVYADGLVTRVVGTSFIIRSSGERVSVIVRSGQVAVYPMNEAATVGQVEKKLTLIPNQQATFLAEENQLTRAIASQPVSLSTVSQTPILQFDDTPITEVFAQLEQLYGIPIRYDAARMKNCFLTSTLADEPFYTKLTIICQTIGASYKVQDTQILITSDGCE